MIPSGPLGIIFQVNKLRLREVKQVLQGHRGRDRADVTIAAAFFFLLLFYYRPWVISPLCPLLPTASGPLPLSRGPVAEQASSHLLGWSSGCASVFLLGKWGWCQCLLPQGEKRP